MTTRHAERPQLCCRESIKQKQAAPGFGIAFQAIVNLGTHGIYGYEAMLRGPRGEPAISLTQDMGQRELAACQQHFRLGAVALAGQQHIRQQLVLPFQPDAYPDPQLCIRQLLLALRQAGLPRQHLILDMQAPLQEPLTGQMAEVMAYCHYSGLRTSLRNLSACQAEVAALELLHPDMLRLDTKEAYGQQHDRLLRKLIQLTHDMEIELLATAVESAADFHFMRGLGIQLFQGSLFAEPAFGQFSPLRQDFCRI